MELTFSDEQEFLREAVRGAVDRQSGLPRVRELVLDAEEPDTTAGWALAAEQGWTGIGVPEEAGGQGGGLLELVVLAEELGRCAVPADRLYASTLACLALAATADDYRARELVGRAAEGEARIALVAASDAPVDVRPAADGARLSLGAADDLEHVVVLADDELRVFDAGAFAVTPRRLVDRTRTLGDVALTGDPAWTVALPGGAATRIAAHAAVLVSADALGAAQRMLDLTVEYVGQRKQFGVAVGSFQAVKHAASEVVAAIEGARGTVHFAGWAVGEDEDGSALDAWVAKSRSSRAAVLAADKALFLHGAIGYTWEHDLQLLFKRAKSDAVLFGSAGRYDDRIADALELVPRR